MEQTQEDHANRNSTGLRGSAFSTWIRESLIRLTRGRSVGDAQGDGDTRPAVSDGNPAAKYPAIRIKTRIANSFTTTRTDAGAYQVEFGGTLYECQQLKSVSNEYGHTTNLYFSDQCVRLNPDGEVQTPVEDFCIYFVPQIQRDDKAAVFQAVFGTSLEEGE